LLEEDWCIWSSLASVIFESAPSLQMMIGRRDVGLEGDFDIYVVEWDGVMDFPGYSVSIIPGVDNLFRLLKER
jgi:hypothetical protein